MCYSDFNMNKKVVVGLISAGMLALAAVGGANGEKPSQLDATKTSTLTTEVVNTPKRIVPTCDGATITDSCKLDGVHYETYIYHPSAAQKSHTETTTTYREEITGYCTLCNDGTYSPSCATGRGACSYHGGVAQWNAPRSRSVAVDNTRTIVDAPAQKAYYEKVLE